jgi:hypothetical protein
MTKRSGLAALLLLACSSSPVATLDAGDGDAAMDATPEDAAIADAATDSDAGCFESTGVWGTCMSTTDCATLHQTATPGLCPGAADIQCCAPTPNVADNPPVPAGWKLMAQADVTQPMTAWAVTILQHPATYPMFSTTTQTFGVILVMARVEWHPPDFQNNTIHRGVTLYEPIET